MKDFTQLTVFLYPSLRPHKVILRNPKLPEDVLEHANLSMRTPSYDGVIRNLVDIGNPGKAIEHSLSRQRNVFQQTRHCGPIPQIK